MPTEKVLPRWNKEAINLIKNQECVRKRKKVSSIVGEKTAAVRGFNREGNTHSGKGLSPIVEENGKKGGGEALLKGDGPHPRDMSTTAERKKAGGFAGQ